MKMARRHRRRWNGTVTDSVTERLQSTAHLRVGFFLHLMWQICIVEVKSCHNYINSYIFSWFSRNNCYFCIKIDKLWMNLSRMYFWIRKILRPINSINWNFLIIEPHRDNKNRQHPRWGAACCCFNQMNPHYETSMALVTFSFGSVFGMVMVRMPSSTLAEIWSFTTSSGST